MTCLWDTPGMSVARTDPGIFAFVMQGSAAALLRLTSRRLHALTCGYSRYAGSLSLAEDHDLHVLYML
jgi:hypothetical protein